MKELAAVVLALASIAAYFVLSTGFAVYQRWPILHYLICAVALAVLARLTFQHTGKRRILAAAALAFTLLLSGVFAWYTLDYSSYGSTAAAVEIGEPLADRLAALELVSYRGEPAEILQTGSGKGILIVFYRGFW